MHYLGNKHRQDTVGKSLYYIVALELVVAGFFYLYWGMKVGTRDTIEAAEYKGKVIAATLIYSAYLFAVAGLTYLVLRKTHRKRVTVTYTILLSIAVGTFFGIAYMGPKVRDDTAEEFARQCDSKNTTSDLRKVDAFYATGNVVLCGGTCPCDAEPSKWASYKQDPAVSVVPLTGKGAQPVVIIPSKNGADNYPECPGVSQTIETFAKTNFNKTGDAVTKGLNLLHQVEEDFECAAFCGVSQFYTFSEVKEGPPTQNCTMGINKVMDKSARITFWSGLTFGIFSAMGVILTIVYIFQRKGDLEEPLLHH